MKKYSERNRFLSLYSLSQRGLFLQHDAHFFEFAAQRGR